MAKRDEQMVVIDAAFIKREALEAVHTFFAPIVAIANVVRVASRPTDYAALARRVDKGRLAPGIKPDEIRDPHLKR